LQKPSYLYKKAIALKPKTARSPTQKNIRYSIMTHLAHAHTRPNTNYSKFHHSLLRGEESYALKHLYSVENTKVILKNLDWSDEEIKTGIKYITIDVRERHVRIHIPGWELIPVRKQKKYSIPDGSAKIVNGQLCRKIRGISRFLSKDVYVDILVARCWAKADPYKLLPSCVAWDELWSQGVNDQHRITLYPTSITCTCPAYEGILKAFLQDAIANRYLHANPYAQGQIPDKHIFAAWKYLNCHNLTDYQDAYRQRRKRMKVEFIERSTQLELETAWDNY
jgi:hypothetical protein